jgi:predicted RND superfamily exporter protein
VSRFQSLVDGVMAHTRVAIAVMLLLTVVAGAGAPMVEQQSSLDQFQTESEAADKLDYVEANFSSGDDDTTTAQVIVRGDDVLSKESMLAVLRYQQRMRDDPDINRSLAAEGGIVGVPNLVATAAIRQEEAREVRALGTELERRQSELEADQRALQNRSDDLNATAGDLEAALTRLRRNPDAEVRPAFEAVRANSSADLNETDYQTFRTAAAQLRNASTRTEAREAYRLGTEGVLADDYRALQREAAALRERGEELSELAEEFEQARSELETADEPTLEEQRAQLESMNESTVEDTVALVLSGDGANGGGALSLMPTDYDAGSTEADATMLVVTMTTADASNVQGAASAEIEDAQLAMQELDRSGGLDYAVFGSGIISHEISTSQSDSLAIVAPLALLFVLLALAVAYRDPLDILLGVFGIGAVLAWTFGFMGWFGYDFNQIFIAVPVLLIGLSIDYAIHTFMRHREERADAGAGPRRSMAIALGGVGVALVWVTATTVIGFLSNLTSPVPPIQDFGVVSSVGITAALLVFGVLVPALKVELDELAERFGLDRRKQAFGTGGGRFSAALSVGATAARRAPAVVIALALLVSLVGTYGATQVDTSFDQSDFIAEQPPDWMDELPEPFRPAEYSAKANLELVNDRFIREDSQAQILVEGDLARPAAMERLRAADDSAAGQSVTQNLSNGEPALRTPLTVMDAVAATNESFNATLSAADTDGDGVPDRNVEAVLDELFRVAPDRAADVIQREDGDYVAARLVVTTEGDADGGTVTDEMRTVADAASGDSLTATATGASVLNYIVQQELLETVVNSLLVTMVAIVLFLAAAYRVQEGSATLGLFTLLPVLLSVSWILGTMYAVGIPFNVLTGMITSLTVGLGVAYSIHLSERYNQELERTETPWEAMETAVTGTGGALLGSAATTVGGFGTLAFAILPPLQQFGIITGLTIVYAFLASVLVLPSLLVVWTRLAGPEDAARQVRETGSLVPGRGGEDDDAPAADAELSPATNGVDPAGEDDDARDGPAAVVGDETRIEPGTGARRSVAGRYVTPGGSVDVEVTVDALGGRTVLRESFDGSVEEVLSVDPEPVHFAASGGSVYVAWEEEGSATLRYRATVPEWAGDDDEPLFTGRVGRPDGDAPVGGTQRVSVVTDVFERVVAGGEVTADDLRVAGERLAEGELTPEQFERIQRAWLRDGGAPERERIEGGEE